MVPFMGFPFNLGFDQIEAIVFVPESEEEEVLSGILDMQEEQNIQMREHAALAELLQDNDTIEIDMEEPVDGYCSDYESDKDMEVFDAQVEQEEEEDEYSAAAAAGVDVDSDAETIENVRDVDVRDLDYQPDHDDEVRGEEEEKMDIEAVEENV